MGKVQRRSNMTKKAMRHLNIANEMLKEGIDESDHGMIKGFPDLEIAISSSTPRRKTTSVAKSNVFCWTPPLGPHIWP